MIYRLISIFAIILNIFYLQGCVIGVWKTISSNEHLVEISRNKVEVDRNSNIDLLTESNLKVYETIKYGEEVVYNEIITKKQGRSPNLRLLSAIIIQTGPAIFVVAGTAAIMLPITTLLLIVDNENTVKFLKELSQNINEPIFYYGMGNKCPGTCCPVTRIIEEKKGNIKRIENISYLTKKIARGNVVFNINNLKKGEIPINSDGIAHIEIGDYPIPLDEIDNVNIHFEYKNVKISSNISKDKYLKALKKRSTPCELVASVKFEDNNSHTPNHAIDAAEESYAKVTISNVGNGTAFNVNLISETNKNFVQIPKKTYFGNIAPRENKIISIPIKADLNTSSDVVQLKFFAEEERGYGSNTEIIEVNTYSMIPSELEIISYRIMDGKTGFAKGNDNGIVENGETFELEIFVKNSGKGEAKGVNVSLLNQQDKINIVRNKAILGNISPGQTVASKLVINLERSFKEEKIKPIIIAKDQFNANMSKKLFSIPVKVQKPILTIYPKINFSSGTSIRNGDTVHIDLIIKNNSGIDAQNVKMSLLLKEKGPIIEGKDTFFLGNIESFKQSIEQRVTVKIPRTYQQTKATLRAKLIQDEFQELYKDTIFNIVPSKPKLSIHWQPQDGIVNDTIKIGQSARFKAIIENQGNISALNVILKLKTNDKTIISSFPGGILEKDLNVIPPKGKIIEEFIILPKKVKNSRSGRYAVEIIAFQKDFSNYKQEIIFNTVDAITFDKMVATSLISTDIHKKVYQRPIIWINYPKDNAVINKDKISLKGFIDDDKGISRVEIKLNDELIQDLNQRGIQVTPNTIIRNNQERYVFSPELKLKPGLNTITVSAWDSDNLDDKKTINITRTKTKSEVWIAIIGINKYNHHKISNLKYAVADALLIKDYFLNEIKIKQDHIFELYDEKAIRSNVEKVLGDTLRKKAKIQDTVIIFYSGHGAPEFDANSPDLDKASKYLLTSDTDPENMFSTAFAMERVGKIFDRISSKRIIFLADTCYSGAASNTSDGKTIQLNFKNVSSSYDFLERITSSGKGRVIITASGPNELAREDDNLEGGHGVFTYFLYKGLKGSADFDKDGTVTDIEVYSYVNREVSRFTKKKQNPVMKNNSESPIILGVIEKKLKEIKSVTKKPCIDWESKPSLEDLEKKQLLRSIKSWAKAWSSKNFSKYITFYSNDYSPKNYKDRSEWLNKRKLKFKKKFIQVYVSNFEFKFYSCSKVHVIFEQKYKSENYKDRTNKQLIFRKEKTSWKIIEEINLNN